MTTLQEIVDAALELPSGDRAQLIDILWGSVAAEDWTPPTPEWMAEVHRRSELYDSGQMTAAPWADVRQRVRREVGLAD